MKIAAVGDAVTVQALRLMGISGTAVASAQEASSALDEHYAPDTVILITESAAGLVRDRVDRFKVAKERVIILEIPSPGAAPNQAEDIARLVSEAIGVKV